MLPAPRGLLLALALALLVQKTKATNSPVGDGVFNSVTNEAWDKVFLTPNATGAATLGGFNVSAFFPSTKSDNWTFTIKVKADVPRPGSNDFATGTWLQFDAPDGLVQTNGNGSSVRVDPSWNVCMSLLLANEIELESDAETVDPGCRGVLEPECIAGIVQGLQDGFNARGGNTSFRCESIADVVGLKCPEALQKGGSVTGSLASEFSRGSTTGTFDYARLGNGLDMLGHQSGNTTAYNKAIRRVWVTGITWGYSRQTNFTKQDTPVIASLACVRASQIEPGSRKLSAGTRSSARSALLMVLTASAAFFWVLC